MAGSNGNGNSNGNGGGADTAKLKALDIAINQIEKQFGRGTMVRLGDDSMMQGRQTISTGSLSLDIAHRGGRACPRAHH